MSKTPSSLKMNYPWLMAALIILMSCSILSSEVFARWCSASTGSDTAQVASFAFSAASESVGDLSMDVTHGETSAEYAFIVLNQENGIVSQIPVRYEIDITLPEVLPTGISMNINGVTGISSADGLTYTFSDPCWEFSAFVPAAREHVLVFSVDANIATSNIQLTGISIGIMSEQVLESI